MLLAWSAADAACSGCGASFPIVDGIPIFVSDPTAHSGRQAEFFDAADPEFEITRPHGTPRFHRWLIHEKFSRSVVGLPEHVRRGVAVCVCGGSGMDAEFLARGGARVIVADVSLGAARRARERGHRLGLHIASIVADAEALPFRTESIDLVYVHDGLHHLERPHLAVAEMLRVSRSSVSVNEPAAAVATRLAVRIRLSELEEEAGNRVERFDPHTIARWLRAGGFAPTVIQRYAMIYRHQPGYPSRFLSLPLAFAVARGGIGLFNRVAGRVGNKFTVQGVRGEHAT
jgi:ubiquinone/menaquinone biosynthesis C-methylase UbiE